VPRQAMPDLEREALIIDLHAQHFTWRAIAQQVGVSHTQCQRIFQAARDRIPADRLNDLRVDHHELAYRAISDLLKIAENPNVSPRTRAEAWNSIRGWSESDRKLFGVDAPTRREITVISNETVDSAIAELNREMAQMEAQAKAAGIKVSI
jgi:AraC-like DNA-binding protein